VLRRTEAEEPRLERAAVAASAARDSQRLAAVSSDGDRPQAELLSHGHSKWTIDGVAISGRAREAVARLKPVIVAVLQFWDHGTRAIVASGQRVTVDASGSYRVS
jgi:hypothetical protein